MTVIITGGIITSIAQAANLKIPAGALIIEGKGKFLIPGLWDMHVHTENPEWDIFDEDSVEFLRDYNEELEPPSYLISPGSSTNLPEALIEYLSNSKGKKKNARKYLSMYVANGVTGIRDMYTVNGFFNYWLNDIVAGRLLAPRIIKGGDVLGGSGPLPFVTVEKANDALADNRLSGRKFIKIHDFLNRKAYFALSQTAKIERFPFLGHVPISITALEASEAKPLSIEHLSGVMLHCSKHEAEIRRSILRECRVIRHSDGTYVYAGREENCEMAFKLDHRPEILQTFDEAKAKILFAAFVKNKTWQCPTLVTLRRKIGYDNRYVDKSLFRFFTANLIKKWDWTLKAQVKEETAFQLKYFQKELEVIKLMHKAGVKFVAGTDTGVPFMFPGFSLHDELGLFVEAGLTPMEALQTATYNAAELNNLLSWYGTIEKNKIADLVILDANPLANIANTKRIAGVIPAGRYLDRSDLKKILDDIQERASREL